MAKKLLTAAEIQAEVNKRIRAGSRDLGGDCDQCTVGLPTRYAKQEAGANWNIDIVRNCVGDCLSLAQRSIAEVRQLYDLA